MELSKSELEIIRSWGQDIDAKWGLHSDERRLMARIESELEPQSDPEVEQPSDVDIALAWQGMSSAERLEFEKMVMEARG